MTTLTLPAVFMRGGTSKGLMFHQRDLPAERREWDRLFLAAMGSPDPYGRQLNGMGGGISSLSKVCVVAPSTRNDADLDYTFAQVQIREPRVDYRANCA
jgi:2-methylaconitate cis-trans-isomerase PrpF